MKKMMIEKAGFGKGLFFAGILATISSDLIYYSLMLMVIGFASIVIDVFLKYSKLTDQLSEDGRRSTPVERMKKVFASLFMDFSLASASTLLGYGVPILSATMTASMWVGMGFHVLSALLFFNLASRLYEATNHLD